MINKILEPISEGQRGIALFISILLSMSLAVIALTSMSRLSETAHQTGKSLQDRKLLMFSESAANIVSAELQEIIDSEIDFLPRHYVHGPTGNGSFKYYPRDITTSGRTVLFGYRAVARLFATAGMIPAGMEEAVPSNGACYDITIDVREVINISGSVNADTNSSTEVANYYLGKMKTVGVISCFQKGK